MKICGIIAEYNPFHNGHKYQIDNLKAQGNADIVIAVMSGNFMQRGVPASFDKWVRTKMALLNGVDIVIELPTCFATSSAEYFASGAVALLNSLNCVDYISFGVKNNEYEILKSISNMLINEPDEYKEMLQKELKSGLSFPVARSKCIKSYFKDIYSPDLIEQILVDSNNILAIEYLKALENINSKIQPILIKRIGPDYNSAEINDEYCSSTAIREILKTANINVLKQVIPESNFKIIEEEINLGKLPVELENFESEILYTLRESKSYDLSQIADVSEGLENVILKSISSSYDLESLISAIKSKRYTRTRIQRILLHSILNIKETFLSKYKYRPQYARVLGFTKNGKKALSMISKNSSIPIITSVSNFMKSANDSQKEMLDVDIKATNLYTLGYKIPNHRKFNLDYTTKIVEI